MDVYWNMGGYENKLCSRITKTGFSELAENICFLYNYRMPLSNAEKCRRHRLKHLGDVKKR